MHEQKTNEIRSVPKNQADAQLRKFRTALFSDVDTNSCT